MKRLLSIVIALLIACSVITTAVYAAETPTFSLSSAQAEAGEEVSITLSISNNPGINGFTLSVAYDSTVLEYVDAEDLNLFNQAILAPQTKDKSEFPVSWFKGDGNSDANGDIVTWTFKIKDEAKAGNYPISISYVEGDISRADENGNDVDVNFDVISGAVTVAEAAPTTTAPTTTAPATTAPATTAPATTEPSDPPCNIPPQFSTSEPTTAKPVVNPPKNTDATSNTQKQTTDKIGGGNDNNNNGGGSDNTNNGGNGTVATGGAVSFAVILVVLIAAGATLVVLRKRRAE